MNAAEVGARDSFDRFDAALYTVAEAARYLDVPDSTLRSWTHGYRHHVSGRPDVLGQPVLTAVPRARAGVPLQRIRPALARLSEEFGLRHALALQRLYTDRAEMVVDHTKNQDEPAAIARS
jgi:transposase-like protein